MGEFQSCKDKSASCYPTRWAWNIWQILPKSIWRTSSRHPTQWARNVWHEALYRWWSSSLHPTQWAWNELKVVLSITEGRASPSHPVGLEVSISPARTGLKSCHYPTRWAWNGDGITSSTHAPSEGVTIPHSRLWTWAKVFISRNGKWILSLSHTVGLELELWDYLESLQEKSPSHPVGSELRWSCKWEE